MYISNPFCQYLRRSPYNFDLSAVLKINVSSFVLEIQVSPRFGPDILFVSYFAFENNEKCSGDARLMAASPGASRVRCGVTPVGRE